MNAATQGSRMRTALMKMLAGAAFGAVAMSLFLYFVPKSTWDVDDPSIMVATLAGACYMLIGLSVAIGLVAPNTGARFLNVEDSDEIREERPKLKSATLVFLLTGAFLLLLAFSGAGAGMYVALNSARAYVYQVAKNCDAGRTTRFDAAGAILLASESAFKVAGEAVQALGGAGYTKDWPVERYMRDAKLLDIGAGTNEIRRMLIGRELIGA